MAAVVGSVAEVEEPIIHDADLFSVDTSLRATQGIACTFAFFCSRPVCITPDRP